MRQDQVEAIRRLTLGRIDEAVLDLRVTDAKVDELRFDMTPPLELAGRIIPTREYVVVQVTLEGGTTGTGYVLTRGQPVGPAAEAVLKGMIGQCLADLFSLDRLARGRSPEHRARAVVDICAWDLLGLLHQTPTWRLLGEARAYQPALLVAGYRRHGENDQTMARRLAGLRDNGFRSIKIAGNPHDETVTGLLTELRSLVPIGDLQVVLDLGFSGRDVRQVVEATKAWEEFGVTWVEDPVPVVDAGVIAEIRAGSPIPLAAGDEGDPDELLKLLDNGAVDVLRADATTVGGLTGLCEIISRASIPTSLHIYPEIHRHVSFGLPMDSPIESFPADDPFDFVDRFIHTDNSSLVNGGHTPPNSPGLGMRYRPEVTSQNMIRSTSISAD